MFECPEERNGFFVKHLLKNMTNEHRNKSIEEVLLGVSRGKVNTFVVNNNSMNVDHDDNIDKFFQWPVCLVVNRLREPSASLRCEV